MSFLSDLNIYSLKSGWSVGTKSRRTDRQLLLENRWTYLYKAVILLLGGCGVSACA